MIVILHLGCTTLRAGTDAMEEPIEVAMISAKYKISSSPFITIGQSTDVTARAHQRTPFELQTLVNPDSLELILDYAFHQIGLTNTKSHFIVTEPLANPLFARATLSELLFTVYGATRITYVLAPLLHLYRSPPPNGSALLIHSSSNTTTIIPLLASIPQLAHARLLPWGANQSRDFLLKLMQVKYPTFPNRLEKVMAMKLYQEMGRISKDYQSEIRRLGDLEEMVKEDKFWQSPFVTPVRFSFSPFLFYSLECVIWAEGG